MPYAARHVSGFRVMDESDDVAIFRTADLVHRAEPPRQTKEELLRTSGAYVAKLLATLKPHADPAFDIACRELTQKDIDGGFAGRRWTASSASAIAR